MLTSPFDSKKNSQLERTLGVGVAELERPLDGVQENEPLTDALGETVLEGVGVKEDVLVSLAVLLGATEAVKEGETLAAQDRVLVMVVEIVALEDGVVVIFDVLLGVTGSVTVLVEVWVIDVEGVAETVGVGLLVAEGHTILASSVRVCRKTMSFCALSASILTVPVLLAYPNTGIGASPSMVSQEKSFALFESASES
eukprot:gb/GECG01010547.1/.p1 GENE.gb/GECG01010547.1/~~gb/GECG01010547.1/.p1  ORF type:complete len:198 (+),score=23.17 gb/GECG01010547.1/:1-594(+)